MFKHILVPTDGSERSQQAVRAAVAFAHEEHAKIVGHFALNLDAYRPRIHAPYLMSVQGDVEREITQRIREQAQDALRFVEEASRAAEVPCATHLEVTPEAVHEAIVHEAEKIHCDLIFMASDARTGLASWLAPSEAMKVMTSTKIPVLLYRH